MKRYYIAPIGSLDGIHGEFHYIDLGSHGVAGAGYCAVVLISEHVEPPADWVALPHLLDAKTTVGDAKTTLGKHVAKLADLGILPADAALGVAQKLTAIHGKFRP